ncbi:MAG: hypothetical protein N2114_06100 [Candidatus Goldbacteria bacterium]|nr:hypothetical protein [Candidatus Goldiibacteriota bacterium]
MKSIKNKNLKKTVITVEKHYPAGIVKDKYTLKKKKKNGKK